MSDQLGIFFQNSLARRCSTTELHPRFNYENGNNEDGSIPTVGGVSLPVFIKRRLLCPDQGSWQGHPP